MHGSHRGEGYVGRRLYLQDRTPRLMTASVHAVLVGVYLLVRWYALAGGSLPLPRNLQSLEDVRSVGNAPIFMLWRVAREGGDIISGVSSGIVRREGRGGGGLNVGVELAEESPLEWELQLLLPFRRGGGGGGTVRPDREGGLSFDGDKVLSTLSLELLILSEYDRA